MLLHRKYFKVFVFHHMRNETKETWRSWVFHKLAEYFGQLKQPQLRGLNCWHLQLSASWLLLILVTIQGAHVSPDTGSLFLMFSVFRLMTRMHLIWLPYSMVLYDNHLSSCCCHCSTSDCRYCVFLLKGIHPWMSFSLGVVHRRNMLSIYMVNSPHLEIHKIIHFVEDRATQLCDADDKLSSDLMRFIKNKGIWSISCILPPISTI